MAALEIISLLAISYARPPLQLSRVGYTGLSSMNAMSADPCKLPGDPSLVLHTNVQLKDKASFLKAASKAVVMATGKPESYVAVAVYDGADLIWGGSDAPAAIGCLYSIGSINMENNGKLMVELDKLLAPEGVPASRTYVNFFDVPRENVGWSGKTFAG
jgi:phenylpyruvate tautomerase PptA (4-oxalocrotonate tautomerase family)